MQTPPASAPRRPLARLQLPHPAAPRPRPSSHICADGQIESGARQQCSRCLTAETIATAAQLRGLLAHPHMDTATVLPALRELAPHVAFAAAWPQPLAAS